MNTEEIKSQFEKRDFPWLREGWTLVMAVAMLRPAADGLLWPKVVQLLECDGAYTVVVGFRWDNGKWGCKWPKESIGGEMRTSPTLSGGLAELEIELKKMGKEGWMSFDGVYGEAVDPASIRRIVGFEWGLRIDLIRIDAECARREARRSAHAAIASMATLGEML